MAEPATAHRTMLAAVWPPTATVAAEAGHKRTSPTDAIRRKCLDCCAGQIIEVRLCEATACPLWPFRAGQHPYTKSRLQEADLAPDASDGTPVASSPSSSPTRLQEPSCSQRGPILLNEEV